MKVQPSAAKIKAKEGRPGLVPKGPEGHAADDAGRTLRSGELQKVAKHAIAESMGATKRTTPEPKMPMRPQQPSSESLDRADDEGMTAPPGFRRE
jgi:hypothetical protein